MPRPLVLVSVFLVSLLFWSVWLLPAAPVVGLVGQPRLGGAPLLLEDAGGRLWDGRVRWRWQREQGQVSWRLDWHGLTPGLWLELTGGAGKVGTWVALWPGRMEMADTRLDVAVSPFAGYVDQGSANGRVSGDIRHWVWQDGNITDLSGDLRYSGGEVRWGRGGRAEVPALKGRLFMEQQVAHAEVKGPEDQKLADARLEKGTLHLRVFRAWPMLLGVSQGGDAGDVVFQVSRPLESGGGSS